MNRLEAFVLSLGAEMQRAQSACDQLWPGTRVASLALQMDATVEQLDSAGALALRVGQSPRGKQRVHALSIEVSGAGNEAIIVRLDGQLLGIYRRPGDEQAQ